MSSWENHPSVGGLKGLLNAMENGEITAEAAVRATFQRIGCTDALLGAWLMTDDVRAIQAAIEEDKRRESGEIAGPLAGVPIGIKDMICTRGLRTTAGSRMLSSFVPPYDATVIRRLRDAGAIIVGKLNQDEFAMGSSNENSAYCVARNPWDISRVPGGSSGGSAVAVASGQVPVALGTDTGGSIRQPAGFCGVVGMKPTYGRVSRYGVIAFASSLDQVGPLGRSVEDVTRVLEVISGHDPLDATSLEEPVPSWLSELGRDIKGLRVGVPKEFLGSGLDDDVRSVVHAAMDEFSRQGASLVPISLPHTDVAVATYYVLATAEASSNLARYDGVRYGHRTPRKTRDIQELYCRTRSEGFGSEVKRRVLLGTYVLSSGYYDAYYLKAQKVRTLVLQDFAGAFESCDVIAAPTTPTTAFAMDQCIADPLQMYLMDAFTIPASLAGLPCLSLPCGVAANGLPVGLQLIAPAMEEGIVLRAASAYEHATQWHLGEPPGLQSDDSDLALASLSQRDGVTVCRQPLDPGGSR